MTARPTGCDVLLSNCPYTGAMSHIEHALALGFRVIVLLLKLPFLSTAERYERMHKLGHLRRVQVLAERLQDMHDAAHIAIGGKKGSQNQVHVLARLRRDGREDLAGLVEARTLSARGALRRLQAVRAATASDINTQLPSQ